MIMDVKILADENPLHIVAIGGEKVYRKNYDDIEAATAEAVSLGIMEPHRKTLVDQEQRRPESAHRWWEPKADSTLTN